MREVQLELAHANCVAAMGQLSASIAHEIKQPLAAARIEADTYIRWLRTEPPNLEKAHATAARIAESALRASEIVDGIQSLFRKSEVEHSWLNINDVINDVIVLLRSEMRHRQVSISLELPADLPPVFCDRVQLQQVVLNLMMNGAEAMSEVGERPRTRLVKSEEESTGALVVSVEDSGVGLDPATADKIFEAFYSTKRSGMGMGLSICRSIIEFMVVTSGHCRAALAAQFFNLHCHAIPDLLSRRRPDDASLSSYRRSTRLGAIQSRRSMGASP